MKYTALIGNPTGHSVSHTMYEELVKVAVPSMQYKHIKIDVTQENLAPTINALRELRFAGLNVTLPHKLSVIPLLDRIDGVAKVLGAVNTIKLGNLTTGYNTDWIGIYKPIKALGREINTATIFGSGGAARAAIYAANCLGASKVHVHYRNEKDNFKTESLKKQADKLGIELHTYHEVSKNIEISDLIINATSAGMIGNDSLPFDLEKLEGIALNDKVYFDAVFNPLETPLLRYFDKQGATTVDGLWMMIYQGIAALEIWLDMKIEIEDSHLDKIHSQLSQELGNV